MRSEEFLVVLDRRPAQVFIKELSRREELEELLKSVGIGEKNAAHSSQTLTRPAVRGKTSI